MSNEINIKDIERQISRQISQIIDDLDNNWMENYADSYMTHMCESVGIEPSEAVERLEKELNSARRTLYVDLSGKEIVSLLLSKMSEQDIVDALIDNADVVDGNDVRSTYLEIDSTRVGEFEYEIDVDDHPELAELVAQLPEDHEDRHRRDWLVYGHPCDYVSLVTKADVFLDSVSSALYEALLEHKINNLLDDEEAV